MDWCYGPHRRSRVIEPYSREIPLYCAFGKVLIAFQPASWRQRFLKKRGAQARLLRRTVLDKGRLKPQRS